MARRQGSRAGFDRWAATYDEDVRRPDFQYEEAFAFVAARLDRRFPDPAGRLGPTLWGVACRKRG